jgi:tetratricopeptide (TPR) repeat protein
MYDAHRNAMTGTAEAIRLYDAAVDRLLRYDPAVLEHTAALLTEEGSTPLAHVLFAYLNLTTTDQPDVAAAAGALQALDGLSLNDRETAHRAVIEAWVGGDWFAVSRRLDDLLVQWPTDVLALMIGHQVDFFVGDAQNLRDRVARSLPALDGHEHQAFVRGMHAFGLEECNEYGRAEEAALDALEVHREDVWAVHAATHVYEMQGRVDTGIDFLQTRVADWGGDNLFRIHNWWHLALFSLEAGSVDRALEIYDRDVHNDASPKAALPLVDASALLWRVLLDGGDVGTRFAALADSWVPTVALPAWYVFNDLHATMALAGAGRIAEAAGVVQRLESYLGTASGTNARMTSEIGLPACRAVLAFATGRYTDVVAELAPIRRVLQRFGGSHAQRDALQRTLLEASLRAGLDDLSRALIAERLTAKPASVYAWTQQARLLGPVIDEVARERADALRDRFAVVLTPALPA